MADVAAAGITVANNPFAIKELGDFYAGVTGPTTLFVMLVATTVTVANMADKTVSGGAVKLLNYAIVEGTPIKVLGIMSDDAAIIAASGTVTVTNGLNADVYTAAANMKALVAQYSANQSPFRGMIGGTSYSGTASALTNETSGTSNNVCSIIIGDNSTAYSAKGAALGELMGIISQLPVQRKISRVKNGALWNTTAYLAAALLSATGNDAATIAGKGFITWKVIAGLSGFYFSSDPTLTVSTDDFAFLCRGRVIDKAHIIAYTLFAQIQDDEVPTNPTTGQIDPGFAANLSKSIETSINQNMTAQGNITGCTCFIDPTQVIVSGGNLNVQLNIDAVGYASNIVVNLAFAL